MATPGPTRSAGEGGATPPPADAVAAAAAAARTPHALAALLTVGVTAAVVAAPPTEPPEHPYLTYEDPEDYILEARVRLRAVEVVTTDFVDPGQPLNIGAVSAIFPVIRETASSRADVADARGRLEFADFIVDGSPTIIGGYAGGAEYARFDSERVPNADILELHFEHEIRSWETVLDEKKAEAVGWPSRWPDDIASSLAPTIGIDADPRDAEAVRGLLRRYTGGRDIRSAPPFVVAKFLMGRVVDNYNLSGDGFEFVDLTDGPLFAGSVSGFEGIELRGPARLIREGRGNPFEFTALFIALCREAGIPTRLVVSIRDADRSDLDDDVEEANDDSGFRALRPHAEFYLYDEAADEGGWIPADPARLRDRASRPPDLDETWPDLGSHEDLDRRVPIAFHFHPPTTVRAYGSPGFWGLFSTPTIPDTAVQSLFFDVQERPHRGSENRDD